MASAIEASEDDVQAWPAWPWWKTAAALLSILLVSQLVQAATHGLVPSLPAEKIDEVVGTAMAVQMRVTAAVARFLIYAGFFLAAVRLLSGKGPTRELFAAMLLLPLASLVVSFVESVLVIANSLFPTGSMTAELVVSLAIGLIYVSPCIHLAAVALAGRLGGKMSWPRVALATAIVSLVSISYVIGNGRTPSGDPPSPLVVISSLLRVG